MAAPSNKNCHSIGDAALHLVQLTPLPGPKPLPLASTGSGGPDRPQQAADTPLSGMRNTALDLPFLYEPCGIGETSRFKPGFSSTRFDSSYRIHSITAAVPDTCPHAMDRLNPFRRDSPNNSHALSQPSCRLNEPFLLFDRQYP
jgi:hypothetical protein